MANVIEIPATKSYLGHGAKRVLNVGAYARVSTEEQNEARQIKAFAERGIKKVFVDKQSGKDTN